jgi:hypothetical protein
VHTGSSRWLASALVVFGFALAGTAMLADDEESPKKNSSAKGGVFEGTWVNRKMGSRGPLRAHITPSDEGEWAGKFEGTFKGDRFQYEVTFNAKTSATKTDLKGNATIDGDPYQWNGTLKGDALNIKYRSSKGFNGDFTLKRVTEAKKKPPKKKGGL